MFKESALMLKALAVATAFLAPFPAFALCAGASFESYLSDEDLVQLEATAAEVPYGEGLFWEAQKGDTTLTIVGTMHLPDPRHDMTAFNLNNRLVNADLLLVEATLQDQADMKSYMASNADLMVIADGPSLPELLDEATWDAISEAASDRGVPSFMAAKMQPWFLLLTLSIPQCAAADMMSGVGGLDALLMEQAAAFGVPTAALEPWQDMFALITAGTFEEQVDALRMGLMQPEISDALMVSLVDGYFKGQTARAWQMTYFTFDFLPGMERAVFDEQLEMMEDLLLKDRNANWIPVIEDAARAHDDILVAFGAAHLIGEYGVLNLLAQQGWTISQF